MIVAYLALAGAQLGLVRCYGYCSKSLLGQDLPL
jgi:hypothetical protein